MKAAHPEYGPRRISDILKRFFFMRTSPATVHKTLAAKGLVKKAPVKAEKNPPKPRFFERARSNQLWQSDILTIRLGGHNAYLVGFIDPSWPVAESGDRGDASGAGPQKEGPAAADQPAACEADRECAIFQRKMALKDMLTELKLTPGMSRAEKNERIGRVLAMITEAKTRYGLPIRILAAQMGLCPATLRRWRRRISRREVPVGRRGPRKVKRLNLGELKERIESLGHVRKRSRGSGSLHRTYADGISRRDLDAMVRLVRQETSRNRVANTYHVSWLRPNLAWAMDDCEKTEHGVDGTLHLHNLTDLHSRYRLPPLASDGLPCGEEVAGHLQYLFDRFDPPLFCKRDNGGNLNHLAVNQVLEEALVIPINSPPDNGITNRCKIELCRMVCRFPNNLNSFKISFV